MRIDFSEMRSKRSKDGRSVYSFDTMRAGDVITVIGTMDDVNNAKSAAIVYSKRHNVQFVMTKSRTGLGASIRIKLYRRIAN